MKNPCGKIDVGGLLSLISILYPDLICLIVPTPFIEENPYGPYIGCPSYANPKIGECFVDETSLLLTFINRFLHIKYFHFDQWKKQFL